VSSVQDLVARLRALDVRLAVESDRLNVNAPKGVLTAELRAELAERKEAIKAYLRDTTAPEHVQNEYGSIKRVPRLEHMGVSHTQQRLWFLKRMDPDNRAYNVPAALWMKGRLDTTALERTLEALVARHESLRTRFVEVEGNPHCVVASQASLPVETRELSHMPEVDARAEAMRLAVAFVARPFDVSACPLMRACLVRVAPNLHLFCMVVDHIIADGLSLAILGAEFQALYAASVAGRQARLPELTAQYVDFVEWQRRWLAAGAREQQLAFWRSELQGLPPVLHLPTDRPRPRLQTHTGARAHNRIPDELAARVKAFARREGLTLFMVMLAAFEVLLQRYGGGDDIAIGTAIANRNHPDIEHMVGFFANNIVLRADLSGNPTVRELLARVKANALRAYAHQEMPFDLLVAELVTARDLEHSPLFQVMFVLNTMTSTRIDLPGLECEPIEFQTGTARFDLTVDVVDLTDEGLRVYFEYNTDLFQTETIERMLGHYGRLLEACVADPDARVADLPMLGDDERDAAIALVNATRVVYPDTTLCRLFEAQVARDPDTEAVTFENGSVSYSQLDARANQLGHALRALGVGRETLVGVWMDRSVDMVVALLGVLKAGGAYVPIDPTFPRHRIEFMVHDAALGVVITQQRFVDALPRDANGDTLRTVLIDSDWPQIERLSSEAPNVAIDPRQLAYVIYTSGSTGNPKGVQIEHRSVVNFLLSMHREPGITAVDRFVSVTTLSFDIAGLEIFGPLTAGGTVVLADRETALDGHRLGELLEQCDATILQATPATWRVLLEAGWSGRAGLKMLCGGEALPRDLADRLLGLGGELWNMYGPTETTIWSTIARVEPGADQIRIGRPIANTRIHIVDDNLRPVPVGVPGELCIAGDGLARGYLGRAELTAEKFVADPFDHSAGARMYRTGDLARWMPDGAVHCLGRVDAQVKIRGYRIEPGEIEAALAGHEHVAQAAVVARPDGTGELRLVAYLVAKAGAELLPAHLRRQLAEVLPEYMIPTAYVILPALPLTPNAKVDRRALPAPRADSFASIAEYTPPTNDNERTVAAIWQEVLQREHVGRNDNFFDLGGHSLLVVRVQNRLAHSIGKNVSLVDLFRYPTVAGLADFLSRGEPVAPTNLADIAERARRNRTAIGQARRAI
jgi:amino acid adenylation domain-containing protein